MDAAPSGLAHDRQLPLRLRLRSHLRSLLPAGRRSLPWQPTAGGEPIASITLRLRLALILTIGAACLKLGAWSVLGVYGVLALGWIGLLRVPGRSLSGLVGAELLFLSLTALPHGWERASFLMARSLVCLLFMNGLLLSLPPHSLAIALKSLPLPAALQETALLAGQYIEILIDEVRRMQRSAACRGLSGPSGWLRYVSAASIGALYVRSLDRAERVYNAMVARGYHGTLPLFSHPSPHQGAWLGTAALVAASLAIASYR